MNHTCKGLFVTATDTGVGKTYVSSLLTKSLVQAGYRVGVYKPVASGCVRQADSLVSEDAVALWNAAGQPGDLNNVCPQCFEAPLAPHLAAHEEGTTVDRQLLREGLDFWRENSDFILVEGAGGLMSPLSDEDFNADLAYEFGFPLLVVAPNQLGVINQTLQTLITASTYKQGMEVAGIVLNDVRRNAADLSTSSNRQELEIHCVPPLVAHVPWKAATLDFPLQHLLGCLEK